MITLNSISHSFEPTMSDISQGYSDITPYDDNMHGFPAQSQEEYDDRAAEGPIGADGQNGDGESGFSSSDNGEIFEVSSVIVDLDPELRAIKGSPAEISFVQLDTSDMRLHRLPRRAHRHAHCQRQ